MDNLLPAVTAVDVTSSQFRETSLPYQQWEATRTHCAPSTPSDIAHLLPPIGSRTARRDPPRSCLPRVEPPLPCPAPVGRNISDLYDPALDPSPIGMEQRGVVQPVRITRVVPRRNLGTPESRRGSNNKTSSQGGPGACSSENTAVTILNGYAKKPPTVLLHGSSDDGCEEEETAGGGGGGGACCIDVFVPRLGTAGIDHVSLLPSEVFHRVLQAAPPTPPAAAAATATAAEAAPAHIPEGPYYSSDDKESSHGLTVFLGNSKAWLLKADDDNNTSQRTRHATENGNAPHTGRQSCRHDDENGTFSEPVVDLQHVESPEEKVTRLLFRREEDGTLAPSHCAFRVQFEPGPLGMELEEDPGNRGVVQIRQVLQAGQAEQDGRLCAGFLVVAVGDWGDDFATAAAAATAAATAMDDDGNPTMVVGSFTSAASAAVGGNKRANATTTRPAVLRSLRELEEAVVRRDPNKLFVLWALDRKAPEAIAALGAPKHVAGDGRRLPRGWSPQSVYTEERLQQSPGSRGDDKPGEPIHAGYDGTASYNDKEAFSFGGVGALPSKTIATERGNQWVIGTISVVSGEGGGEAPGWESDREHGVSNVVVGNSRGDHHSCAFSSRERWVDYSPYDHTQEEGAKKVLVVTPRVSEMEADLLSSTQGLFPLRDLSHRMSTTATLRPEPCRPDSTGRQTGERFASGAGGGWDFETGGGIFDDNDQGLAARKQPLRHDGDDAEEPVNDRPPLPLGLEASAVDELSVFIWFSNNHESAMMQVSWIDYDGKLIPRRSLAPGACYFERSFATHPWVIQQEQNTAEGLVEKNDGMRPEQKRSPEQKRKQQQQEHDQKRNDAPSAPVRGGGGGGGGDCCVLRLGDAMAVARLTGSLIWNPSEKTLSVTKQAKVGVAGMSASALAAVGSGATEGAGVAPGKKQICMVGGERETEAMRAKAERASVRKEKARILEEMRTWRRYPPGSVGVGGGDGGGEAMAGGLGQGAPNLRVVMIGSSLGLHRWAKT